MARTRKYYLKNNYLTLKSKVKVPRRSLWYVTLWSFTHIPNIIDLSGKTKKLWSGQASLRSRSGRKNQTKTMSPLRSKGRHNKMNCELMLTYDTPALRQTGIGNLTGQKMLPTIWGTYMKLVTKYQISAINSCLEKCD